MQRAEDQIGTGNERHIALARAQSLHGEVKRGQG